MARSEARILVEIWDDQDFVALSPQAQRMFIFLLSQKDLAHTGVIALRERRWSRKAADLTVAEVGQHLDELARASFLVVDEEAEEVLVRSFIRRDKVYRQPNVLRAAADHLPLIASPLIRDALAVEIDRIVAEETMTENSVAIIREMQDALRKGTGNPSQNPSGKGSGNPSRHRQTFRDSPAIRDLGGIGHASKGSDVSAGDKGSRNPSGKGSQLRPGDRGEVTAASRDSPNPVPLTPNPEHQTRARGGVRAKREAPPVVDQPESELVDSGFERFWTAYPRKVDKGHARKAWTKSLRGGVDPAVVIAAAERYRDDPTRRASDPKFTAHPTTWLNGERWLDLPDTTARASPNGGYRPYFDSDDPARYEGEL